MSNYVGRFAPSPTGELHAGSLACALATYLDARAHNGVWIIRIENIDPPREKPGAIASQLSVLDAFEMYSDREIVYQSERSDLYEASLEKLRKAGLLFGCACSRKSIEAEAARLGLNPGVYPGTCRAGCGGKPVRAWRFRVPDETVGFDDRLAGHFEQHLTRDVGDFVLKRADGLWAYQLAVVTDDAAQGITHVVRGADLLDNTPRQIALQRALGLPTPVYMHIPLVLGSDGKKLSKQNSAVPIDMTHPEEALLAAWRHLGFEAFPFDSYGEFYKKATRRWLESLTH